MIVFKQYPGHFAAIVLALAVLTAVILAYRLLKKDIGPGLGLLLRGLRIAVMLALLLVLFDPVRISSEEHGGSRRIAIYLDRSLSMSVRDAGGTSRLAKSRELAERIARRGDERNRVDLYAFADTIEAVETSLSLAADGPASDITGALRHMHSGARQIDKAVIFSDGNPTEGGDPLEYMRRFGGHVPIYTIGIGHGEPLPDVGLVGLDTPESATAGDRIPLSATVFQRDLQGREAVVVVTRDDKPVWARKLMLNSNPLQRVTAEIPADRPGWNNYRLHITVPDAGEEFTQQNNISAFTVRVVERRPLKVLYVETSLRWTTRFLSDVLDGDQDLDTTLLFDIVPQKIRSGAKSSFPAAVDELFLYDVLILGDLRPDYLSGKDMQNVYDFVARRGGGLALVAGLKSLAAKGYADTPIEKLLPVYVDSSPKTGPLPSAVEPLVTVEGRHHHLTASLVEEIGQFPSMLKVPWDYRPKPAASVLVHTRQGAKPLLTAQRFGKGYVLFSSSGFLWKWAFHDDKVAVDPDVFSSFWRNAVRWLGRNRYAESRFRLYPQTIGARPGDAVRVLCEVLDADHRPDRYAEVVLSGVQETRTMTPLPDHTGVYVATVKMPHREPLYLKALVSRNNALVGEARTVVQHLGQDEESRRLDLNEKVLRGIAGLSGGKYLDAAAAVDLDEIIEGLETRTTQLRETKLWDRWPVLAILAALLCVEWFTRRAKGLA
ncbi:MAG: hypothetical protein HQ559_04280 [Lentisphaerae bacterium]|nr:hypothetical protein [Lentisphaerota bacterium]